MNQLQTKTLPYLLLPCSLLLSHTAQAQDCKPVDQIEAFATDQTLPSGAACSGYVTQSAQNGTSCHWEFPYRATTAPDFADTIWTALQSCRAGTPLTQNNDVNHPDSYALREWDTPTARYAISVKDKGGLNRTFVFLRVEPKAP